jgi:hypothetical protein
LYDHRSASRGEDDAARGEAASVGVAAAGEIARIARAQGIPADIAHFGSGGDLPAVATCGVAQRRARSVHATTAAAGSPEAVQVAAAVAPTSVALAPPERTPAPALPPPWDRPLAALDAVPGSP